nr:hypothetical protein [uncultured Desulfobacter sp.]
MKKTVCTLLIFFSVIVFILGLSGQTAQAIVLKKRGKITDNHCKYTEYLGLTGVFSQRNAPFRIVVPRKWNGKLLIYARGTGTAIMLNKDNTPIFDSQIQIPIVGVTPLTNVPGYPWDDNALTKSLETTLLEMGYALAASNYKEDKRFTEDGLLGWVVEDGIRDTLALTFQACFTLMLRHGQYPEHTILWGRSQGSIIALKILEKHPRLYDGIITGSTVGAGTSKTWDIAIDFALAYDAAFGWPEEEWGPIGDVNNNIRFNDDVFFKLYQDMNDPLYNGLLEFIRLVNKLPEEGFSPFFSPDFNWFYTDMLFVTEVRADLENKAGGAIGQNMDHVYRLSADESEYLNKLGVNTNDLLTYMNSQKVKANKRARKYLARFGDFSGEIYKPVISMHTIKDGLVPPRHESVYLETVANAGHENLLLQVFVEAVGHCTFTPEEWVKTIEAMDEWLDTGERPEKNEDFFPYDFIDEDPLNPLKSGGSRFSNDFIPPPWYQPPPA